MSRPAEKIEVIHYARTETEAAVILAALREAGIDAQTEGGLTSALRAEAPGEVRVLVRASDLPRAQKIIARDDA
jgi:type III secretory pathway lipoprotein EscJ